MSDEHTGQESRPRSWLDRIAQIFSDEPTDTGSLLEILRNAAHDNVLDADALSIIEGALQVSNMQVREIMIPRPQMVTVSARNTLEEVLDTVVTVSHSRFPVVAENSDSVIGILLAKDLLPFALKRDTSDFDVKRILRPATFVPESKRLNVLLREFRETRHHMAIVIDEYGSACGVVTIEDVLEQIVGEIDDEYDVDDDSFIKRIDAQNFVVKALTPIAEFNEAFEHDFSDADVDTLGGLVLRHFGHIPERDETVVIGPFRFTILSSDSRQVRLLKVTRLPADGTERSR